jgi:hypothetical protein
MAHIDISGILAYAPAGRFDLDADPSVRAWMTRLEALSGYAPPDGLRLEPERAA